MKRLLNIFAGITIVAATATTVAACGSKTSSNKETPVKQEINQILQDIQTKNIDDLSYGKTYSTIKDKDTLINKFEQANPTMTNDLKKDQGTLEFATTEKIIPMERTTQTITQMEIKINGTTSNSFNVGFQVQNTWNQVNGISRTANVNNIPKEIDGQYYVGTLSQGLWESANGINWTQVTKGLSPNLTIYHAPVEIDGVYYLSTANEGLWRSEDKGKTWQQATFQAGTSTLGMHNNPTKIDGVYYVGTNQGLWSSSDGKTWNKIDDLKASYIKKSPVKIDGVYYVGTKTQGLWSSSDGKKWTQIGGEGNISKTAKIIYPPVKIEGHLFVGTGGSGLWRSSDGIQWSQSDINIPKTAFINHPPVLLDGNYYVGTYFNGLWKSSDGSNWKQINATGLANNLPNNARIYYPPKETSDGTYYVGTETKGLWTSSDGSNWSQSQVPGQLKYPPAKIDGHYYAATLGEGLWRI